VLNARRKRRPQNARMNARGNLRAGPRLPLSTHAARSLRKKPSQF